MITSNETLRNRHHDGLGGSYPSHLLENSTKVVSWTLIMQLRLGRTPKMAGVELHILNQYHVTNQLIPPRKLDYNHRATFSSASLISFVIPTTAKRHKNQVNDLRVGTSTSPSLCGWKEFLKVVFGEVGHWKMVFRISFLQVFRTVQQKLATELVSVS